MSTASQKKKTKINSSDMSLDETWRRLSHNIREIFAQNAANLSFEENHRFGYNLVLGKQSEKLYEGVKVLVVENLQKMIKDKLIPAFPTGVRSDMISRAKEGEELLKAFRCVWDDHESGLCKLRDILKYLDRVYAPAQHLPVIYDAGVLLFHTHIIVPPIEGHLIDAVLDEVRVERDGFAINQSAVRGCVEVLSLLRGDRAAQPVYLEKLKPPLLEETRRFYETEGKRRLESFSAPEYLAYVDKRFIEEILRAQRYLTSQIAPLLQVILEETLLAPHLSAVIYMPNSGMDTMIDTDKVQSLNLMYKLFKRVDAGVPTIRSAFKDSIVRRGNEINMNADAKGKGKAKQKMTGSQTLQQALKWVQDVLDLKDKFNRVWSEAFDSDRELETATVEGFEKFINTNPKAPEFISLFIDENLKKGVKDKTDLEVDAALDKTITVFRYLTDKDVFERYYKGHLAKRLLLGRSVSHDAERQMLGKLKVECGHQFTQKLEGMFNDMKLSAETMDGYRAHLERTTVCESALRFISVTVMTSTYWPSAATVTCTLPDVLAYYLAKHTGRRLAWQPSMGTVDVRVQFKARKHDLTVSTIALVILLLFEDLEDDGFQTYEEIKMATNIPDGELSRNLQSLACAKVQDLEEAPARAEILQKIKISTVSSKVESTEERKETHHRIDEERRHQQRRGLKDGSQACIVRIMKDRKHMTTMTSLTRSHDNSSLDSSRNPMDIKKRIEGLIEREYLERCDDRKSYNYMPGPRRNKMLEAPQSLSSPLD
ncbi:Cullin-domain-containing protein [Thelephora terrestris]|uniref:Cullin-domain-containing protein n=1 Tax=Thelephora terrestris TaxID=56493 RepID=A0A9P6HN84_9AGAM|nr:Cullin-domain-containing protein [Thelephora terrestris]